MSTPTPAGGELFALVEARKTFFWLNYEREHRSPLVESGMIWRCQCAAPAAYGITGKTAEEAVRNALNRAAELEKKEGA